MYDAGGGLELRLAIEQRFDHRLVAEHDEFGIRMPCQRDRSAGDRHRRTMVAAHGVDRDANLSGHGTTSGMAANAPEDQSVTGEQMQT